MELGKLWSSAAALAIAAAMTVAVVPKASADSRTDCQRRVEKLQEHYRHEAREHGRHSRQAEQAREKLNAQWDRCWNEAHGWYDPHRHEWRTDRDWDRNYDWDHDGDRDDRH
jgi:hypothetical protein